MFLSGLKAKSIYRKVTKALAERSFTPLKSKIKTIIILQDEQRIFTAKGLKILANSLNVHEKDINLMTKMQKVEKKDKFETTIFSEKQIGWNGVLKSIGLKDFSKTSYDVLINYYIDEDLSLKALSAFSNAKFKVGLTEELADVNDLVVNIPMGQEETLIAEIKKYMLILNLIN